MTEIPLNTDKVITLNYDPIWEALEWVKENCPSYITNRARTITTPGYPDKSIGMSRKTVIDYYFADDAEAVMFALRWC